MPAFQLSHKETGVIISGYVLRSASIDEVNAANKRMADTFSEWRYQQLEDGACVNPPQNPAEVIL